VRGRRRSSTCRSRKRGPGHPGAGPALSQGPKSEMARCETMPASERIGKVAGMSPEALVLVLGSLNVVLGIAALGAYLVGKGVLALDEPHK
jgi:hypothetical protein